MEKLPDDKNVPIGMEFLTLTWDQENRCEAETDKWLPEAGVKAPKCLDALGTVLSLADRLASCWWGCRGGDHVEEYLVGRAVSNCRAALRLLRFGFYDEALSMIRSIGENANLLSLFLESKEYREDWRTATGSQRRREFSPVKARMKLAELRALTPMDEEKYRRLCEPFVHPSPQSLPQAHNVLGLPSLGGLFQEAGVLVVLNELAWMMTCITGFGGAGVGPKGKKDIFLIAIEELEESIGRIDVGGINEYWDEVRQSVEFMKLQSAIKSRLTESRE